MGVKLSFPFAFKSYVQCYSYILSYSSMADNDVKAKLEAKKKRLEELKKARINRQKPTPVSF